jgi:hypothetical protein
MLTYQKLNQFKNKASIQRMVRKGATTAARQTLTSSRGIDIEKQMFVVASIMYNSIYSNVISFSFCKSEA